MHRLDISHCCLTAIRKCSLLLLGSPEDNFITSPQFNSCNEYEMQILVNYDNFYSNNHKLWHMFLESNGLLFSLWVVVE